MWYVLEAAPDAHLIAGLKRGATRSQFEANPQDCIHRFPVRAGDAILMMSNGVRGEALEVGIFHPTMMAIDSLDQQMRLRQELIERGCAVTDVLDRQYFQLI